MRSFTAPSTDGVVLSVHDLGGSGRDALFGHATGFPVLAYRPLLDLVAADLRVVAPDLRGAGSSGWPLHDRADWQGFADDLAAAGTAAALAARPLGVGHSSGATALLLLEARRPGSFSAIWCYEPAYFPPDADGALGAVAAEILARRAAGARRRRAEFASREAARARLADSPLGLDDAALGAYLDAAFETRADGSLALGLSPEREAAIYESAPAAAAALDCGAITCPVRLVCGSASEPASRSGAERLAGSLPAAHLEELAGLSHLAPLADPEPVAAALRRWLGAGLPPRETPAA